MDNDQIVGFSVTLAVFIFTDKSLQLIVIKMIRHTQGEILLGQVKTSHRTLSTRTESSAVL